MKTMFPKFKIQTKVSSQVSCGIRFKRTDSHGTDAFGDKFKNWDLWAKSGKDELRIVCNNNRGTCIIAVDRNVNGSYKWIEIKGITGVTFKNESEALKAINSSPSRILKSFKN